MRVYMIAILLVGCAKTSLDQLTPFDCFNTGFCPTPFMCVNGQCEAAVLDGPCQVTGLKDPCALVNATCLIADPTTMTGMCVAACTDSCAADHACVGAPDIENRVEAWCLPVTTGLCPVPNFQPTPTPDIHGEQVQACAPIQLPALDGACGSSLACLLGPDTNGLKATQCLYGTCVPEAMSPNCGVNACASNRTCVEKAATSQTLVADTRAGCFAPVQMPCPAGDVPQDILTPPACVASDKRLEGVPCLFDTQCMYGLCDKNDTYKACSQLCSADSQCGAGFTCNGNVCELDLDLDGT
jgi:hypothetical protein